MTQDARSGPSGVPEYDDEERSEIAGDVLTSLKEAESGLWCIDHNLARAAKLLIDEVEGAFSGRLGR